MAPQTFIRQTLTPRVRFYLEKRNKQKRNPETMITENVPIRFSVSFGSRYMSSTGLRVDSEQWDEINQLVKPSHKHAKIINKQLRDMRAELEKICYDAWDRHETITPEYISSRLLRHQKSARGLFDHFDEYIEQGKTKWSSGYIVKLTSVKNLLEEFKREKGAQIEYDRMNEGFYTKLLDFYFYDKDFVNSHVRRITGLLQQFLRWAEERDYNRNKAYKKWKLDTGSKKETKNTNVFLTIDEQKKIFDYVPTSEQMALARDYLLLACNTGLRHSDIENLKKTYVDWNTKEIHIPAVIKTHHDTIIPLNEVCLQILEKYRFTPNYNKNGIERAFPTISDQKTNVALKKMAEEAGINSNVILIKDQQNMVTETVVSKYSVISTHTGRKTFITNCVNLGIPSEITMAMTGHRSHKTMEIYYTVQTKAKRTAVDQLSRDILKVVNQ